MAEGSILLQHSFFMAWEDRLDLHVVHEDKQDIFQQHLPISCVVGSETLEHLVFESLKKKGNFVPVLHCYDPTFERERAHMWMNSKQHKTSKEGVRRYQEKVGKATVIQRKNSNSLLIGIKDRKCLRLQVFFKCWHWSYQIHLSICEGIFFKALSGTLSNVLLKFHSIASFLKRNWKWYIGVFHVSISHNSRWIGQSKNQNAYQNYKCPFNIPWLQN